MAQEVMDFASRIQEEKGEELKKSGLTVSFSIGAGDPRQEIVREAVAWGANSIFVGARGLTRTERFLLGSVSGAVASRARCSVEIVRN
jgi:nucleotide-binding universal stress UspA family protein